MKKKSNSPRLIVEAVTVAVKLFFFFLMINNLVWGILYFKRSPVSINQTQSHDIVQDING